MHFLCITLTIQEARPCISMSQVRPHRLTRYILFSEVNEEMQASDSGVGAPMGVAGVQSRSEDEESLGIKDVKRSATQAFGGGVPKRRSSSRFESQTTVH